MNQHGSGLKGHPVKCWLLPLAFAALFGQPLAGQTATKPSAEEGTLASYLPLRQGLSWRYQVVVAKGAQLPYQPIFEVPKGLLGASGFCGRGTWRKGDVDIQIGVGEALASGGGSFAATLDANGFKFLYFLEDPVSTKSKQPAKFEIRTRAEEKAVVLELVAAVPLGDPNWRLVRPLARVAPADLASKLELVVGAHKFRDVVKTTIELIGDGQYMPSEKYQTDVYLAPQVGIVRAIGKDPSGAELYRMDLTEQGGK